MRNIFIIYGSNGNPQENWFPWLKAELEKLGHRVFVPQFPVPKVNPTPNGHKLHLWMKKMHQYDKYIDDKTIFIAHSRGCVFLYHFLSTLKKPVAATFLVGSFIVFRWYTPEWKRSDSFMKPYFWDGIKKGSKYFEVYQSTNDTTPVWEGEEIARELGAKLVIVKNAYHFNVSGDPRFKKFPLLLENLNKRL